MSRTDTALKIDSEILRHETQKLYVSFVDFQKSYDSVDRETLFNALREYGVDQKTPNLIKLTLTNAVSKVKFHGEIGKPFGIGTGLRQGDGLSPTPFNVVVDKIMKTY